MAVVFISPKQRQKMFITGITVGVGLFCIIITFIIFFSQPKVVTQGLVLNKPKVSISFKIFDSDQFSSLEPFKEMETQFSYKATIDNKEEEGYISANSIDEAKRILEELGYKVNQIEEAEVGRENPFEPYATIDESQNLLEYIIEE
jgi:hypothetical protein